MCVRLYSYAKRTSIFKTFSNFPHLLFFSHRAQKKGHHYHRFEWAIFILLREIDTSCNLIKAFLFFLKANGKWSFVLLNARERENCWMQRGKGSQNELGQAFFRRLHASVCDGDKEMRCVFPWQLTLSFWAGSTINTILISIEISHFILNTPKYQTHLGKTHQNMRWFCKFQCFEHHSSAFPSTSLVFFFPSFVWLQRESMRTKDDFFSALKMLLFVSH